MTKLSVNINKLATLRNSRGGNNPDIIRAAIDAQKFGADGITIHPRPDERHIRYDDVRSLKKIITTEFNIEGNPQEEKFVDLVLQTRPTQVTLVPDTLNQVTSNHGWNTIEHKEYLTNIIAVFKSAHIRTSIFIDPAIEMIEAAAETGTDRVELYTEAYAHNYNTDKQNAISSYLAAAVAAREMNIGLNAGHDLDLTNLHYLIKNISWIDEVSIGHALICDAIYYGFENTIQLYKRQLVLQNDYTI
ncbi:MAG: pyridoxine 5'-phosphate synthase [Parafilimonas sp.]